ncbi:family 10 glycosylhydrolase [Lachnospiraceae bacterium MD1]|jgi:uncharacterized lipoprotein YddW (UPF0748 family)|uniref:Family 10 glycosylhydrolase n=1 Tax=Variimorphobacter saccharofermentans TaxID=2755051 RepID=A0A839JZX0_9FIRM|nr:family 10 glycosylhydrolase [Variimorphobacter saccharofermentans]MBB2182954.1 family 10 glycosylhydrolase [Variimorphobacter saccharofermentans]
MSNKNWMKLLQRALSVMLILFIFQSTIPMISIARANTSTNDELQAVWISYLEFQDRLKDPKTGKLGFTEERFHAMIDEMFDNVVSMNMNAVVVHVRPFADAMYPSQYFPWSKYISGTQGKDPGFDPLEYMVKAAHDRGLEFHAWINPYRITNNTTDVKTLSKDNLARIYRTNDNKEDDRCVLTYDGMLYYNPSDVWVHTIILDGIMEIIENYDVDGIHFDDYFYPALGKDYKKNFDYKEYKEYSTWCKENGIKPLSIADWRRDNVNALIRNIYEAIKEYNKDIEFGISPGGFIDNLLMDDRYYSDIKTWLSEPGYIDYICPQLYWSFSHKTYPFDKTLNRWLKLRTNKDVKMYVGIATYRAGSTLEPDWKDDPDILKDMIEYGRKAGADGYMHFRYDFFYKKATKKAVTKMLNIIE